MDPTQQQQPMQQAYGPVYAAQPPPASYQSGKGWRVTKVLFHVASIIFGIIALGISISMVVSSLSYVIVWTAPQAVVSICWATAELITFCVRRGKASIHPGAHVALHLILWLGYLIATGLNAYSLAGSVYYDSYHSSSYSYSDYYYYDYAYYSALLQALVAFCVLLVIVHFFLFVRACVETAHRNSVPRMQYVVAPPQMYQQQPQQYAAYPQQQQQPQYGGYYPPQQQPQPQWNGQQQQQQPGNGEMTSPPGVESHFTGSSGNQPQQQQGAGGIDGRSQGHMSYPSSSAHSPPPMGHELPEQQQQQQQPQY